MKIVFARISTTGSQNGNVMNFTNINGKPWTLADCNRLATLHLNNCIFKLFSPLITRQFLFVICMNYCYTISEIFTDNFINQNISDSHCLSILCYSMQFIKTIKTP